jgi:carbamate kinase
MKRIVIALGGNAIKQWNQQGTAAEQYENVKISCAHIVKIIQRGYQVVITHGNGPQVGALLLQQECSKDETPSMPLDVLVAMTEGSLGYVLQQNLLNQLRRKDVRRYVVTVVTQVLVDESDPAFKNPTKPIGPFLTREEAERRRDQLGWIVKEDAGRGWRRLVPSPRPLRVIQRHMIREAARSGHIVIACGGGGIPIKKNPDDSYAGVEAVIDKDLTSSVLATDVGAALLIILTAVPQVFINFGTPDQRALGAVTLEEIEDLYAQGHFPAGSMGPKIEAVVHFLKSGGRRALITNPESLPSAIEGRAGTHIVGRI